MAEVIELLSSSPPQIHISRNQVTALHNKKDDITFSDFDFDTNPFDSPVNLDFRIERSAKRRRLSPEPVPKATLQATLQEVDAVFDLSSEADPDFLPRSKAQYVPLNTSANSNTAEEQLLVRSSSAPEPRHVPRPSRDDVVEILSDRDGNDLVVTSPQPPKFSKSLGYSNRTAGILATLGDSTGHTGGAKAPILTSNAKMKSYARETKSSKGLKSSAKVHDKITDSSQQGQNSLRAQSPEDGPDPPATKVSKAKMTLVEKQAEQERKRLEKERKAADKQLAADMAEANKAKTNKKIAAREMYIELPSAMKGKSVGNQVEESMKEAGAAVTFYHEEIDLTNDSPTNLGHIIKWKRKVESRYDENKEEWLPISKPVVEKEKHILVYLTAEEFCTIAAVGPSGNTIENNKSPEEHTMKENLNAYMKLLRSRHPHHKIVFLIQGLTAYLKKSATAKNREYIAAVRSQNLDPTNTDTAQSSSSSTRAPKKRKSQAPIDLSFITTDLSEALQLHLQLHHPPLSIVHTTSPATTAHQISTLTTHLATRPYRFASQSTNLSHASFCMDGGQIKTGQGNARETFILMLQEINRVTVSMAHGVLSEGYDGPASLAKAFKDREAREGREESRLLLKDVRKAMNRDGGLSDRPLGAMVSKRLWKVFMGRDEGVRDGIA